MIVTKIEAVSKIKFKVYLEEKFAFILYKGELSRFGIREGEDIPGEILVRIRQEVILKRAKARAMHLLEDMDRTEAALREKLRQGMYPEDAVDGAVEYVKSFGYLNDDRYAENFVRSRMLTKSRREIQAALMRKGLTQEQIRRAFDMCDEEGKDGEEEAIRRILDKKHFDPDTADRQEIHKICAYLARKGFRYDTIRQVIQNAQMDA